MLTYRNGVSLALRALHADSHLLNKMKNTEIKTHGEVAFSVLEAPKARNAAC
jgi:hypothetical protein